MASVDLLKSVLSLWKLETWGWKWVVGMKPRVYARLQDELLGCNDLLKEFQVWVPCQGRDGRVVSEFRRCALEHDGCCDQGPVRSSTQQIHREYSCVIAGEHLELTRRGRGFVSIRIVISLYPVESDYLESGDPRIT